MASTVYLPDGQTFTVMPVFAGLFFKSNELNTHHNPFPVGWTVVLHTGGPESTVFRPGASSASGPVSGSGSSRPSSSSAAISSVSHSFRQPTLHSDALFISSISNPSSSDFKPAASPTRQIAMMLWVTLYWYFQQPAPNPVPPPTPASASTPPAGRPRGEWCIRIQRDGVLRSRNLIPKLERMGLIAAEATTTVTMASVDGSGEGGGGDDENDDDAWNHMYVSQSMFWQTPAQLFLFTLQPLAKSPAGSRPGSPEGGRRLLLGEIPGLEKTLAGDDGGNSNSNSNSMVTVYKIKDDSGSVSSKHAHHTSYSSSPPPGPFFSSSHLPTYFPPAALRYTMTDGVRHPVRPKPPSMGEVFYTRFIPSVNQYLSLRVASSSPYPVPYLGPVGPSPPAPSATTGAPALTSLSDTELLQRWFSDPRVSAFWGSYVPNFLPDGLASRHSFPVIGLWDGVPFGYFEIYWVKEDILGRHIGGAFAQDFDRGLHVFIGEGWARGRVPLWLSSIVHWIFTSDNRTMSVNIEPRVDNIRFIQHLQKNGFSKQREVTFPHKQSWFGRLYRDGWTGPAL